MVRDDTKKPRVLVGMSGGVDSSVTAGLLLEQGYEVIGVTMRIWQCEVEDERTKSCCSLAAVDDARKVAETLGIPFYVLDFRDIFKEKVIDNFVNEYLRGRTPNPCIACNRHLKFGLLLEKARALGAEYIATGHYAKTFFDEKSGRWQLLAGDDQKKDQSYVLYNLTQEQLSHTLFPLGSYTKPEIRQKAKKLGLVVHDKAESQEICFITDDNYKRFISERVPAEQIKPGNFITHSGEVLGRHEGLPYYTVGQRKGLGMALGYPAYVLSLDPQSNTVTLGRAEENYASALLAADNNFIAIAGLDKPLEVEAKIRYAASPAPAVIAPAADGRVEVRFDKPQRAITPGQAVVWYQGGAVVGGGVIDEVLN